MTKVGKIFYLMGPSGSGKDSLINYIKSRISAMDNIVFSHRYINRPMDRGGENHVALSDKEFDFRINNHCFAMHWSSHGVNYAIGTEINQWLDKGINVVVNGSRAYLQSAAKCYPEMIPVNINVSSEKLKQRLQLRGRENAQDIKARLQRNSQFRSIYHPHLITINNDGDLENAGEAMLQLLSNHSVKVQAHNEISNTR